MTVETLPLQNDPSFPALAVAPPPENEELAEVNIARREGGLARKGPGESIQVQSKRNY